MSRDVNERLRDIEVAGMRDFIAHAYFAVDLEIVWDTVRRDVPELHGRIRQIIQREMPSD